MAKKGGIKQLSLGRKDLFLISPNDIQEQPGWNVREENEALQEHVRGLADSIKELGVLQPLTVYMDNNVPIVTDGHCRLLAVKLAIKEGAEIKAIPVRTEERFSNEADRVLTLLTRNNGKQLAIPEQAEVVRRLLAFNWSESSISRKTGLSKQHIYTLIKYLSSPPEVKDMVKNGEVSATLAISQLRKEGAAAVNTLKDGLKKAKRQGKKKATAKDLTKKKRPSITQISQDQIKQTQEQLDFARKLLEEVIKEETFLLEDKFFKWKEKVEKWLDNQATK